MQRTSPTELEMRILDAAAGLFAKHGFDHTSIQAIADSVGYSKAGLLHHFPNKEALWEAAVNACRTSLDELQEQALAGTTSIERDHIAVAGVVSHCEDFPGFTALLLGSVGLHSSDRSSDEMIQLTTKAFEVFGVNDQTDDLRRVRVASALASITLTTLGCRQDCTLNAMREHIIAVANDTLGHNTTSSTEAFS